MFLDCLLMIKAQFFNHAVLLESCLSDKLTLIYQIKCVFQCKIILQITNG